MLESIITNQSKTNNIQGVTALSLEKGEAIFAPSRIYGTPSSYAAFKASNPSITRYYSEFFGKTNTNLSDFDLDGQYFYVFLINFRECEIGEIFIEQLNRLLDYYINKQKKKHY